MLPLVLKHDTGPRKGKTEMTQPAVKLFSLSTCSHCKSTKRLLDECTIQYEFIDVDLLQGDEEKGYFFNADKERVFELLEALVINKERYGYMVCPCRLASGEKEKDKDIICPCVYRIEDVKEFGSCYCNLYVSEEWNKGKIEHP